jgi:hypothetical protein
LLRIAHNSGDWPADLDECRHDALWPLPSGFLEVALARLGLPQALAVLRSPVIPSPPKIDGMRDLRTATLAPGARFMLAAVALALFGLLSMHGWGSHTLGHSVATAPATSTVAMDDGHTAHSQIAVMGDHTSRADGGQPGGAASTREDGTPGGDHGASLLGLCLAVLSAMLLGIGLLLARRKIRIPRPLLPAWPPSVFVGRNCDPPDLLQLCVIRC